LGGKFTVAENARRLLRFFYFERRLMQSLGAWTLSIPEFEVKLETAVTSITTRTAARRVPGTSYGTRDAARDIDGFRDAEIDNFIEELLSAANAPELLAGVHQCWAARWPRLTGITSMIPIQITDVPTIRCLRRILADYEPMLAWADAAVGPTSRAG
jgi:hypothetical protein